MWCYKNTKEIMSFYRSCFAALDRGQLVRIYWCNEPLDREGFKREFIKALHARINHKTPNIRPRKADSDYQISLMRDKYRLQDIHKRIRVYQFETKQITKKFGHLLADRNSLGS